MPEPRLVLIEVTPDGLVVPDLVDLDVGDLEEAQWYCQQGTLEIRFSPNTVENPFGGDGNYLSPSGGACISGFPVNGKPGRTYKYSVIVTTNEDPPRVLTLDPRIRMVRRERPHSQS